MTPSKNLIGTKGFRVMNTPTWDFAYGIWQTQSYVDVKKSFSTPELLVKAAKENKVKTNDVVRIRGKKTCAGRASSGSRCLPSSEDLWRRSPLRTRADEEGDRKLLERVAKNNPTFTRMADAWKLLGARNAQMRGLMG